MGKTKGQYEAEYPVGTTVKIASMEELQSFRESWNLHNPLSDEQMDFAGTESTVTEVGFYHGGDELYSLAGIPGQWHECCLKLGGESSDT